MIDCNELVRRVRVVINEVADDGDVSLLSVDTRSLDDTILELLPQAVAFIQKNKGIGVGCVNARSARNSAQNVVPHLDGGLIALPDDFEELVSFTLEKWQTPVYKVHAHNSCEAAWQRNEYTRAGYCRPVCVETFTPGGIRCLLVYPFAENDPSAPENFIYEARFNESDGLNNQSDAIVDAVVYKCASLLYMVFERYDAANSMLTLALAACGGQVGKKQ